MKSLSRPLQRLLADDMHRNSTLLIAAQLITAGALFLFWIITARIFPARSVGLATGLISLAALTATFTNLGLPNTVIRFLPTSKRPSNLFAAALVTVVAASSIGAMLAWQLQPWIAPSLHVIHGSVSLEVIFGLAVIGTAVGAVLDGTLVALKRSKTVLTKAVIIAVPRLLLPFVIVGAGLRGITSVFTISLLAGTFYVLSVLLSKQFVGQSLRPSFESIAAHKQYAFSNYLGGMFGVLPITVTPIVILNALGPVRAAYFYMPLMIAAVLSLICNAISQALISEAAQTDDQSLHRQYFLKAWRHQYRILLPLVGTLIVLGWPILRIYGPDYARNGYDALVLLAISGLLVGVNWLGDTWLNIQKRSRDYFVMNALNAISVVVAVWLFAPHGLQAAAIGWLCGQLVSVVVYAFLLRPLWLKV